MKVIITGSEGFVGRYLRRRLESSAEVLGIDCSGAAVESRYHVNCNILDFEKLRKTIIDFCPDRVIHLAGLVHPAESMERPREFYMVNVQGTVNLLESLRQIQPPVRLLIVSTAEVYGGSSGAAAISESTVPFPQNHYATSKLAAEHVALQYRNVSGIPIVIARPFNHSGPGQSDRFVIADFCRQIADAELRSSPASGTGLTMQVGNLEAERDFLDVRDVVDAYVGLIEHGNSGEVYNICSGTGTTARKILDTALRSTGVPVNVEVSREKYRPLRFPRLVGDNAKLKAAFSWEPKFSIENTINDTLEYWRSRLTSSTEDPR
jgi:GDP-4-dehydro-6-deoxy-D-mannose reductase